MLAVHPSIKEGAERLCLLYREKDVVEKDFGTIKGLIELRPIRHRTDVKVRAHVTVCMLALLLERTLAQRLGGQQTAQAALDELETCHLNRYQIASHVSYALTEPNPEQQKILRALKMDRLSLSEEVTERLSPR